MQNEECEHAIGHHSDDRARRRDHRQLGRELGLYSMSEAVGPGLPLLHPNGAMLRHLVERFSRDAHILNGYELVNSPHVGGEGLWYTSGHLPHFAESMFAAIDVDGDRYYLKPMNCPFHVQIYKSRPRSYRDLPQRYVELGTVYRYELSGVLQGLTRVRGFTVDDSHIFCRPEQVHEEIRRALDFSLYVLGAFGLSEIRAYVATKPKGKAIGAHEDWAHATQVLRCAVDDAGVDWDYDDGGGAFYGPKIDLKVRDAAGREWQLSTVQFDFNLPERFGLSYIGSDGGSHRPVMVHRALFGSVERFLALLIEHYQGAFPVWLAPVQVSIVPVAERHDDAAGEQARRLADEGFRAEVLQSDDRVGARIRSSVSRGIPYQLVVGDAEVASGRVSVRRRGSDAVADESFADFAAELACAGGSGKAVRLWT